MEHKYSSTAMFKKNRMGGGIKRNGLMNRTYFSDLKHNAFLQRG
jgi:hypothetical protein